MSGFIVIVHLDGTPLDPELFERLTARLIEGASERGRVWSRGGAGMGYVSHAGSEADSSDDQPATLDGAERLVSSARIDARSDLAERLGGGDKRLLERTSDAELILRAFRRWDTECPSRLLGDFAFALWDGPRGRLFCARDRFGMRQLYYARVGKALLVSDRLYCLLGHPGISRRLDEEAMGGFLLFGDHTWVNKGITAFEAIRAVPPAHGLLLQDGRIQVERYWEFPIEVPLLRYRRDRDVVERFRAIFGQAVADRLRSRSVAIAMSGGMDSSSMAAMALRVSGAAGAPVRLRAMTVLYDRIMPSEERRYAGEVAERLGIPIDVFDGGSHGLLAPPIATERPLELYTSGGWIELFREAGDQGGGLLHGEGGDSLFSYSAGPATLKGAALLMVARDLMRLRRRYGTWPGLGTGLLARLQRVTGARGGGRSVEGYPYPPWLNPDFERRLNLRERWQDFWHRIPSPLNERHPRMHEGLVGPDWNLQGNYLHPGFPMPEIGDPFLDLRLIELVLALPPLPWTFRKHLLRRSMADVLPEAVLRRPKTPLGEIHRVLLARPEAGWVDDWRAGPALGAYVRAEKLPPLRGEEAIAGESYVNLRPLLLERWIGTVSSTLAIGGSPPRLSPSLVPGDGLVPLEGLATD